jgi:membrane AbrB-like protein
MVPPTSRALPRDQPHKEGHERRAPDSGPRRATLTLWAALAGATMGGGWFAGRVGLPSGYLFAAMLAGLAAALLLSVRLRLPERGFRLGQAVTGAAIGTSVHASTLTGLGARWAAVALVGLATLAVTICTGLVLSRITALDRPTASLGMIAGGASGIVGMADDLGGDDRLVAFMQYLRVLIITLITPLLVPLAFGVHVRSSTGGGGPLLGNAAGAALTVAAVLAGLLLAPRLRLPAPALLGPLILTAVASGSGMIGSPQVPALAREAGFAVIGLRIGLGFDRPTLRTMARLMLPVCASIALLLVVCFGFAWLLELSTGVSLLDGYLATTPGGLYAVLPIAFGSGADTTFVLAVQTLRLLAMMLAAPAVVRWLLRPW